MPHLDDINSTNLDEIRPLINNLDYVMFFGTLLGFVRNDSIIQDDDDIDFALNYSDRNSLINILENSNNESAIINAKIRRASEALDRNKNEFKSFFRD